DTDHKQDAEYVNIVSGALQAAGVLAAVMLTSVLWKKDVDREKTQTAADKTSRFLSDLSTMDGLLRSWHKDIADLRKDSEKAKGSEHPDYDQRIDHLQTMFEGMEKRYKDKVAELAEAEKSGEDDSLLDRIKETMRELRDGCAEMVEAWAE